MSKERQKRLGDALDRLAAELPADGALLLATDPVAFLDAARDRIVGLRAELRELASVIEDLHGDERCGYCGDYTSAEECEPCPHDVRRGGGCWNGAVGACSSCLCGDDNALLSAVEIALIDIADEYGPVSIDTMSAHTCCSEAELRPHVDRLLSRGILARDEDGKYRACEKKERDDEHQ